MNTSKNEVKNNKPFVVFVGFGLILSLIHAFRNRSFWLDECFVANNLLQKSPLQILSDQPLLHNQFFPRTYLALVDILSAGVQSTFIPRFLPLIFGLLAIVIWLMFFKNYFFNENQKDYFPFVVASGLFVANGWVLYYPFELKQYSAELFFSGALFYVLTNKKWGDSKKFFLSLWVTTLSLLFTYSGFIVFAGLGLYHLTQIKSLGFVLNEKKNAIISIVSLSAVCAWVYFTDLKAAIGGGTNQSMNAYWADYFVTGNTFSEKMTYMWKLLRYFLTDFWKTQYGPMSENFINQNSIFFWDFNPINNPDIRKFFVYSAVFGGICTFSKKLHDKKTSQAPIRLALMILLVLLALSWMGKYPLGPIRPMLFAMPLSIVLITNGIQILVRIISKLNKYGKVSYILWIPALLLILRNSVYLTYAFSTSNFHENMKLALNKVDPSKSNILVVAHGNEVHFAGHSNIPKELEVYFQRDIEKNPELSERLNSRNIYYLWGMVKPTMTDKKEPIFLRRYNSIDKIIDEETHVNLGLLLAMKNRKS